MPGESIAGDDPGKAAVCHGHLGRVAVRHVRLERWNRGGRHSIWTLASLRPALYSLRRRVAGKWRLIAARPTWDIFSWRPALRRGLRSAPKGLPRAAATLHVRRLRSSPSYVQRQRDHDTDGPEGYEGYRQRRVGNSYGVRARVVTCAAAARIVWEGRRRKWGAGRLAASGPKRVGWRRRQS